MYMIDSMQKNIKINVFAYVFAGRSTKGVSTKT